LDRYSSVELRALSFSKRRLVMLLKKKKKQYFVRTFRFTFLVRIGV